MIRDHVYVPEEPWQRDCCQHRGVVGGQMRVCNAPKSLHAIVVTVLEGEHAEQES